MPHRCSSAGTGPDRDGEGDGDGDGDPAAEGDPGGEEDGEAGPDVGPDAEDEPPPQPAGTSARTSAVTMPATVRLARCMPDLLCRRRLAGRPRLATLGLSGAAERIRHRTVTNAGRQPTPDGNRLRTVTDSGR